MTFRFFIIITFLLFSLRDGYAQQTDPETSNIIKIGLLVSDDGSAAARNGAELAVETANNSSDGKIYKLVVRSMEGPWGTGSKEAVNLVFNEKVWAILGSHDGRNAHLVEQVVAKTHVVFLSARATDPTLYQAFVPWYFSCVPNDLQQADALINEMLGKKKCTGITTVSGHGYDLQQAQKFFIKQLKAKDNTVVLQSFGNDGSQDLDDLLNKIEKSDSDCILLLEKSPASINFLKQMHRKKMDQSVFATISLMSEDRSGNNDLDQYEDVTLLTNGNWLDTANSSFAKAYKKKYDRFPGATASYAYDGINLIIEAIRRSGNDREKVQEAMSEIKFKGVTGSVEFDENGSRKGAVELISIKNGIPVFTQNN